MKRILLIALLLALLVAVVITIVVVAGGGHFPWFDPAGVVAARERQVFLLAIGLSVIVVVPVFTLLAMFAWKFREGNKKADYQPEWSENNKLEAVWWGIPIAIIAVLATVVWFTTHELDPYRKISSDTPTLKVQVVALEWKWLFIYPDYGVATVNELRLPVDTPVHFTLAADAPMSAFWVPSLGSQIYAMNGMSSQLNLLATKTGTYKGYNTNINGEGYAKMTFDVPVVGKQDFAAWTKKAYASPDMLDEKSYNELAKPSLVPQSKTYMLMTPDLYDTIVMKYMAPKKPGDSKQETATDETTGHQHHMEGM